MKLRIGLAILTTLVVASVAQAATDDAAPREQSFAQVVGSVKIKTQGTKVKVTGNYACPTGESWHLWVSVKQAADGSQDPLITEEGAGDGHKAAAWLQDHPTKYTCDGRPHTWNYTVTNAEPGYGTLIPGSVWVQYCLINEPAGIFLIDQHWADAV